MDSRRSFGRRAACLPAVPQAVAPEHVSKPGLSSHLPDTAHLSVEDEIAAWKAARGSVVPFPWRQLSLMAGLCFGIASFILPATINDTLQWPLYALAAVSLYAGSHKRKAK
jgi:hypothetical protein